MNIMSNKQVVHLTSVHSRYDTRIFMKECQSLVTDGYSVSLVVADGKGNEIKNGVLIIDVGAPRGRLDRMLRVVRRILATAKLMDAVVYHFHDPELITVGQALNRIGKKVIFDSHEDVPKQLLDKPYIPSFGRYIISRIFANYEKCACRNFDAIVAATPNIRDKFLRFNPLTVDVNNFPLLGEFELEPDSWNQKLDQVCYVGSITGTRGVREIVRSMERMNREIRLKLCGRFAEKNVAQEVKSYLGWKNVDELGWLDRPGICDILCSSIAGFVTFHPEPNHIEALPTKMFEYMSAGVPVIASNFPLWRTIVEGNDCGICVDPLNPSEIAAAINFLIEHPDRAGQMGQNGQRTISERYNWSIEEKKLVRLYARLLNQANS